MPRIKLTLILTTVALTLAACGGNQTPPVPTISIADVQTLAVSTFAAGLTQTAAAIPTPAATETPAPTNTIVAFNTFVPLNGSGTPVAAVSSPTTSCNGLEFINDISIPDNTKMAPGKKFTKTWLLQNTGGCAWQPGFKWTVVGGDPMGGSTVTLTQAINPGAQYQISVPMIAPTTLGTIRGTWRMFDLNGNPFGDAPWVQIVVQNPAASNTPSVTDTPTP